MGKHLERLTEILTLMEIVTERQRVKLRVRRILKDLLMATR